MGGAGTTQSRLKPTTGPARMKCRGAPLHVTAAIRANVHPYRAVKKANVHLSLVFVTLLAPVTMTNLESGDSSVEFGQLDLAVYSEWLR